VRARLNPSLIKTAFLLIVLLIPVEIRAYSTPASGPAQSELGAEASPASPQGVPAAVVTTGPLRPLHAVLVDKSRQRLYLYLYHPQGKVELIRSFPCSTGRSEGDKLREGDRRTPEGIYFFTKVYRDNKVTIFGRTALHLNYPDPFDQAEGREGNGIYLHGTNRPLGSRATNGCVVMNNKDLDFLSSRIEVYESPIIISPRLRWVTPEELQAERAKLKNRLTADGAVWLRGGGEPLPEGSDVIPDRSVLLRQNGKTVIRAPARKDGREVGWRSVYLAGEPAASQVLAALWQPHRPTQGRIARIPPPRSGREEIMNFLQGWVRAWESRNVDQYMAFYSPRFRSYGMNHDQWRDYKSRLAQRYKAIDVEISEIEIQIKGSKALVSFRQNYYSDQFQDVGQKSVWLRYESGGWKIRREDWKPAQRLEARR